ncbi:unnamed protein product [Musa hybrid cultivar]
MGNHLEFYFEVLHIPKHSSPQEIRTAYRALVKKWHPDKHPPSSRPEVEAKFKAISEAYKVLLPRILSLLLPNLSSFLSFLCFVPSTDLVLLGSYLMSRTTEQWLERNHLDTEARSCRDCGERVVQEGSSRMPTGGPRPPSVERKLGCTLEELCRGCKKEVKFTRDIVTNNGYTLCSAILFLFVEELLCVQYEPGWKKGTKITFEGKGDERPGSFPADIVFVISEKEHPNFKRVGNDLVLKAEVPLVNALTGWSFSFCLPTGEKMSCSFQDEIIYPLCKR